MHQLGCHWTDFHKISFIVDSDIWSSAIQIAGIVTFPWQQWLRGHPRILRYTRTLPVLLTTNASQHHLHYNVCVTEESQLAHLDFRLVN
jgi:hypothetical protein